MGIRFTCHACTKRLNVKAFLAGKRGICPHCGVKVEIPWQSQAAEEGAEEAPSPSLVPQSVASAGPTNGSTDPAAAAPMQASIPMAAPAGQTAAPVAVASASPSALAQPALAVSQSASAPGQPVSAAPLAPATPQPPAVAPDPIDEAPGAVWYVRPPSGGQYGPASGEIMRKWVTEGRVSADSLVWRESWADWKSANDLFPSLSGGPVAATSSAPAATTAAPSSGTASPNMPALGAATAGGEVNAPGRGYYPRRQKSNSLAIVLIILLTLASLGLFGVLIAVISFMQF